MAKKPKTPAPVTVGYRYYMKLLMGICRGPINSIEEITVGDKTVFWRNDGTAGDNSVNFSGVMQQPDLFGGDDREGGIEGTFHGLFGGTNQTSAGNTALLEGLGEGPRGCRATTFVYDGQVSSNSPYPKPWKFRVRRTDAGWDGAVFEPTLVKVPMVSGTSRQVQIGGSVTIQEAPTIVGMNPAHIIYEVFTNREWGRGLLRSRMDDEAFRAAAVQLKNEGFGLCLRWNRKDALSNFVKSIIDHIGANVYTSRKTGLVTIKLIRGDYDIDDVPHFTHDTGMLEVSDNPIAGVSNAVNEVVVNYRDQVLNEDRTVRVGNLAALQAARGVVNSRTNNYPGVSHAALALRVAQRDLKVLSSPLRKFTVVLDRRGFGIEPGDVIAITDAVRGIPKTVIRVGTVDPGSIGGGKITVVGVQDVFALPDTSYQAPVESTWVRPNTSPCVDKQAAFELPYFMLARLYRDADLATLSESSGYVGALSSQGRTSNLGYKLMVRESAPTADDNPTDTEFNCGI